MRITKLLGLMVALTSQAHAETQLTNKTVEKGAQLDAKTGTQETIQELEARTSIEAAGHPTIQELVDACNKVTDVCDFHPQQHGSYPGQEHQVGSTYFNCSQSPGDHQINWNDQIGGSDNLGLSVNAAVEFLKVFTVGFQTTYQHTWSWSHTDGEANTVHVNQGSLGWITRAPLMQWSSGQYEMHFSWPYYGHYYWYIDNFRADGPDPTNLGSVVARSKAMTPAQLISICNRSTQEASESIKATETAQVLHGLSVPLTPYSNPPVNTFYWYPSH